MEGNIAFKKPSLEGFFSDLISARAIIANSGFSLVTEALHLGKPYLAVPVSHQFEQIFNAYWLEKSGYGAYWEELNKECVESFLYNLPHYRQALAQYPRQGNQALFGKLDGLIASFGLLIPPARLYERNLGSAHSRTIPSIEQSGTANADAGASDEDSAMSDFACDHSTLLAACRVGQDGDLSRCRASSTDSKSKNPRKHQTPPLALLTLGARRLESSRTMRFRSR